MSAFGTVLVSDYTSNISSHPLPPLDPPERNLMQLLRFFNRSAAITEP
jgi:hypothetical protein